MRRSAREEQGQHVFIDDQPARVLGRELRVESVVQRQQFNPYAVNTTACVHCVEVQLRTFGRLLDAGGHGAAETGGLTDKNLSVRRHGKGEGETKEDRAADSEQEVHSSTILNIAKPIRNREQRSCELAGVLPHAAAHAGYLNLETALTLLTHASTSRTRRHPIRRPASLRYR
jgi:hypothetical protein